MNKIKMVPNATTKGKAMQKTCFAHVSRLIVFVIVVLFSLAPVAGTSEVTGKASPGRVAFLPFTIHAAKDLSYLKEGIRDMLASRLSADTGISVIDKVRVDKALAAVSTSARENVQDTELSALAEELQADYVVLGSLTALGGSMSLDAKVIAAAAPENPNTFYATAASEDEVIPAINQLAEDIGAKIFGSTPSAPTAPRMQPTAPAAAPPAGIPEYQTAHPERAFLGAEAGGSPLIRPGAGTGGIEGFTKSQNFAFSLQAMDVGDVDGDGSDDIVMAAPSEVLVFHRNGSRFNEFGRISLASRYKIHAISVADLNNNGRAEIYISTADKDGPYSFGAEWQGKDFSFLFEKERWYIKTVNVPGQGMVLAGQRAGHMSPLEPEIYQLISNGAAGSRGSLQKGQRLPVPGFINVFSFVFADIDGDGEAEIIHIDQNDYLNVLRAGGKLLWRSSGTFGGTTRFIGGPDMSVEHEDYRNSLALDKNKKIYIPSRLITVDLNHDNLPDIVINRNQPNWSPIFKNLKSYSSGSILGLTWNGIALTELWYTKKIDGYITDYQFKLAADNKNAAQLYVGLILQSGTLNVLSGSESTVLIYNLDLAPEQKKGE